MGENGSKRTSAATTRNLLLFSTLKELRKTPRSPRRREEWIIAAIDLTKAVFTVQFASMRNSPDREDLEQAALLEFHRVADKLALLTETLLPEVLFRVLYSVAKYAMFRELSRLKKGSIASFEVAQREPTTEDREEAVEDEQSVQIALSLNEPDAPEIEPVENVPGVASVDRVEQEVFIQVIFPEAVLNAVDDVNIYALTQWGEVVRFCALQRLRGRFPSLSMIRNYWRLPDPVLAIAYGEHVARHAILRVPEYLEGA